MHSHFNRISLNEAQFELTESKRLLADTIGKPVDLLAWPYGECSAEVEQLAGECGYRAGWSVWQGTNGSFSRWRVPLGRNDHIVRFIAKASGVYRLTEGKLHRFREQHLRTAINTARSLLSSNPSRVTGATIASALSLIE